MSEELEFVDESEVLTPELFNDVVVYGTDWTVETIFTQLSKGNIKLDPPFQRRDAWKLDSKSRFIESLIFGVPVPQILLSVNNEGKFIVLDGKQRLGTLFDFLSNTFKLKNMVFDVNLEGAFFRDLEINFPNYYNQLCNNTIRTTVIKKYSDEKVLHQIFLRVNTGTSPLSPQELRKALHPGPFVDFANTFTMDCLQLQKLLGNDGPDNRMRDAELFVRALGFHFFHKDYIGNMWSFLDKTCSALNKEWAENETRIKDIAEEFKNAIDFTFDLFGDKDAFKVYTTNGFKKIRNRVIIDIMLFYFMDSKVRKTLLKKKERVVSEFKILSVDDDFAKSLSSSTNSFKSVRNRFNFWWDKLNDIAPELNLTKPYRP